LRPRLIAGVQGRWTGTLRSRVRLWCFSFACCRCLGAWLRGSRCLIVGLVFVIGRQRLRTWLICCAGFLTALVLVEGKKRTADSSKEDKDNDEYQGNYQRVSKEVFY
jgi:hypothetical protein